MSDNSRKRNKDKIIKGDDEKQEKHCTCDDRNYTTLMICCDYCSIWYHAKCMGLKKWQVENIEKYACLECQKHDRKIIYNKSILKDAKKIKKFGEKIEKKIKKEPKVNKIEDKIIKVKKEKEGELCGRKIKKNSTTSNPDIAIKKETEPILATKQEEKNIKINPTQMLQIKPESIEIPIGEDSSSSALYISKQQKLQEEYPKLRCQNCIGCFRDEDCGKCAICVQKDEKKLCISRICVQVEELFKKMHQKKVKKELTDSDGPPKSKKGRKPKNATQSNGIEQNNNKRRNGQSSTGGGKEDQGSSVQAQLNKYYCSWMKIRQKGGIVSREQIIVPKEFQEKQCFGPNCDKSVRPGSNYCSEKCGLELAQTILPQRANIYFDQIPSCQKADRQRLEDLENQLKKMQDQVKQLESWKENVNSFIDALKNGAQPSGEKTRNEEEGLIFSCPICASEFPMREITKHMQNCYVRSEKQTTYGTDYKMTGDTYNLYCDQFNKINQTYCKRLRYACAEHYKDEYDLKICGCPLIWFKNGCSMTFQDLFTTSPEALLSEFCQEKSKSCRDHLNWIQTAFSMIDNEIMNLMNKMDEIVEQGNALKQMLFQRGDVLTLITSKISSSKTIIY